MWQAGCPKIRNFRGRHWWKPPIVTRPFMWLFFAIPLFKMTFCHQKLVWYCYNFATDKISDRHCNLQTKTNPQKTQYSTYLSLIGFVNAASSLRMATAWVSHNLIENNLHFRINKTGPPRCRRRSCCRPPRRVRRGGCPAWSRASWRSAPCRARGKRRERGRGLASSGTFWQENLGT